MSLNLTFHFFKKHILISIWVSIKIEKKKNLWKLIVTLRVIGRCLYCIMYDSINYFYFEPWLLDKLDGLCWKIASD